ncbi:MAG: 50S ribosomal protein L35 [Candidatus Omnitrophica bacterium]|nr:50S ribosomal protein L35 [Candidatus Omnitrophota bacterium]MCM8806372.1 50S ribosomal protein L35 [Candidatus Omnitrophota bacterium]
MGKLKTKKLKTKKSVAKRFKITGTGKVMHYGAGGSHLLSKKSSKRKRRIKRAQVLKNKGDIKVIKRLLPYA